MPYRYIINTYVYIYSYIKHIVIKKKRVTKIANKIDFTCATSLSLVFLLLKDIKNTAGNIKQIITPIVDPTIPRTNSMFGTRIPIIREMLTIATVRSRNLDSDKLTDGSWVCT